MNCDFALIHTNSTSTTMSKAETIQRRCLRDIGKLTVFEVNSKNSQINKN